jgi:hypothetical protein
MAVFYLHNASYYEATYLHISEDHLIVKFIWAVHLCFEKHYKL